MANENQLTAQGLSAYMDELAYQLGGVIKSVAINAAGTGYTVNDVLTIVGGLNNATVQVDSVGGSGEVTAITVLTYGNEYNNATGAASTGGTGTGATFDLTVNPVDAAALLTLVDAFDQGVNGRTLRLKQVLKTFLLNRVAGGGKIISAGITGGGTGYLVGDILPVTGTTGIGGAIIVTSATAGVIDGVAVLAAGGNYSGVIAVDATGSGNGDAVLTAVASYESEKIVTDALAAL